MNTCVFFVAFVVALFGFHVFRGKHILLPCRARPALLPTLVLFCVAILWGCAPAAQKTADRLEPSIHWRKDFTGKYLNDPTVGQLIAVQYMGGYKARVLLFVKSTVNGNPVWTEELNCDGLVGMNGIGKTREGDNKTPTGDFGIITAFGIKANPGTALPWVAVNKNIYCCDDPPTYNQIVDISSLPHTCTGEHLVEYSPEYNYGFFLDYNREGTPGKGSAIFFHCTGANAYTGGCVAINEKDMVTMLRALKPGARVVVDWMPKH